MYNLAHILYSSFGVLIKYTGRVPIFVGGALINIVVIAVFFNWTPNPHQVIIHLVQSGF